LKVAYKAIQRFFGSGNLMDTGHGGVPMSH